jgi:CubicO group peptidase (beta-lactamase class C family)
MEAPMQRGVLAVVAAVALVLLVGAPAAEDKAAAVDALLASHHEAGVFNGAALVSAGGAVILKKGYGFADFEWRIPNTPDTKFRLGSITKQFTAAVVMQLVEEGRLSLETTLSSAVPYYRKDTGARITVHHLLNHTSGIPSYTGMPNFFKDVSRDPYGVREFVEQYCSGDLEFEPGSRYAYNNSGYFLLGAIIEEVTGKPYQRVVRERIFEPLGMKASGYDLSRPVLEKRARGYEQGAAGVRNADYLDMLLPYAAGSLYSTVEDLYVWDQALYGGKVLPPRAMERMFTPGLENYGYGWIVRKRPVGVDKTDRLTIGHGGGINGFNTLILRVPEDRHLVVLLNNTGGTSLGAMADGILDILYGRTPPAVKRPVAPLLYETIQTSGVEAAVARYREIAATRASEFDLGAGQLTRLAAELAAGKRAADAEAILGFAAETFPSNAGVLVGLANAYREAGKVDLAVETYKRLLEIDPDNRLAADRLAELVKK